MTNFCIHLIRLTIPVVLVSIFTACGGGGGGGGGGTSNTSPNGTVTVSSTPVLSSSLAEASSVESSSLSSFSDSSDASSDAAESSSSLITKTNPPSTRVTHIGTTFVAEGTVNSLLNTGGELSVEQKDKTGMTLYVFDKDRVGESTCVSEVCVTEWPPFLADADAVPVAPLTVIQREDGRAQWALRDRPLYFYHNDSKPGDLIGEGVGGLWHVALPAPLAVFPSGADNYGDYFTAAGKVLVGSERLDRSGFSLYTFDDDAADTSSCTDSCLANWPALIADEDDIADAPYGIITRIPVGSESGVRQWTYQGMPLYFFVGDTAADQVNGEAIAKWHLARPRPTQVSSSDVLGSLLSGAGLVKTAISKNAQEQINHQPKHGFTLYTFDADIDGESQCVGACVANWPALIADVGAVPLEPFSVVARASGEYQWALNGKPLYFFAADKAPGDINGEDFGGLWHVARVPPVVTDSNGSGGLLFAAHGNLAGADGSSDSSRDGFTLYTFETDPDGQSVCNDSCATTWPPLYAPASASSFGDFSVVVRAGGATQWAYRNRPLYFFSGDTSLGDVTGVGGSWLLARP